MTVPFRSILRLSCGALAFAMLLDPASPRAHAASARDLSSIDVGDWVEAEVQKDGSGTWRSNELDLKGAQESVAGAITGPLTRDAEGSLAILGVDVVASAQMAIKDTAGENISLDALAEGSIVEARLVREDRGLVATKLRARALDTPFEVEGPVESITLAGEPALRILGFDIEVAEDAEVRDATSGPRFAQNFDDDELVLGRRAAVGPFLIGADARAEVRPERNYDLNSDKAKDLTDSDLTARLEISSRLGRSVRLFSKGAYRHRFILQDERGTKEGFSQWELSEAYVALLGVGRRDVALQIGRQRVDDEREWLFDENLDAVRAYFLGERVIAEASVSTKFTDEKSDLASKWNEAGSVVVGVRPDVSVGVYAIHRGPRAERTDSDLTWFGARVVSAKIGRVRGWADAGLVRGEESGLDVSGSAFHVTTSILARRAGRVMLNAAWARGAGDADLSDGKDGNFRQTGLEDNNDRFGGVTSFQYYGELFRPMLSNLEITSLGVGFRPTNDTSVDLLAHRYRQVEAAPFIRASDLEARPLGLDPDIGREVDLVIGVRTLRWMRVEYVLGAFWAGAAFPTDTERAVTSRLQLDIGL